MLQDARTWNSEFCPNQFFDTILYEGSRPLRRGGCLQKLMIPAFLSWFSQRKNIGLRAEGIDDPYRFGGLSGAFLD